MAKGKMNTKNEQRKTQQKWRKCPILLGFSLGAPEGTRIPDLLLRRPEASAAVIFCYYLYKAFVIEANPSMVICSALTLSGSPAADTAERMASFGRPSSEDMAFTAVFLL